MFSKLKKHIMALAVLAVAVVQFFGMSAGFLCACTGEVSAEPVCVTETCHPDKACGTDTAGKASADCGGGQSANADDGSGKASEPVPAPCDGGPDHKHSEIRKALILAGVPPVLASPPVVFFDLIPSFQLPDLTALNAPLEEQECPAPPEYGSPPAPEMVARTIVLLV
jgi:hypothetical protein